MCKTVGYSKVIRPIQIIFYYLLINCKRCASLLSMVFCVCVYVDIHRVVGVFGIMSMVWTRLFVSSSLGGWLAGLLAEFGWKNLKCLHYNDEINDSKR